MIAEEAMRTILIGILLIGAGTAPALAQEKPAVDPARVDAAVTAAFPVLSRDAKDPARFAETLGRGIRLSLFIALPATAGLLVTREALVGTLYSGLGDGFSIWRICSI